MFCMTSYAKKIFEMKRQGMAQHIKNLVLIGVESVSEELQSQADSFSINLHRFETLTERNEESKSECPRVTPEPDFVFIISYTSGTTGDPKGVKLSHSNLIAAAKAGGSRTDLVAGEAIISYLPYTHSFEQSLFGFALHRGLKIGFYQGNPLKLFEDCAKL